MGNGFARVVGLVPRGATLTEASFTARHRIILAILALLVPLLAAVGVAAGAPPGVLVADLAPLVVLVGLGTARLGRLGRMLAVSAGLSLASPLLVHLSGGMSEAYLLSFVSLALIALYQDWRPYLMALLVMTVPSVALAVWDPRLVWMSGPATASPLRWALVHAGFVLAVAATHLVFWRITEAEAATSRELWHQLYEGERALVDRLQAAESVKTELLSVVSHEFRTPLTSIIGFSHTLMARADQLDPATIRLCVRNIDQQSRRLARLVHNVLAASGDIATDPTAVTELSQVTRDVAREIGDAYDADAPAIVIEAPPSVRAAVDADAAGRILANLLDNAVKFSVLGNDVGVRVDVEGASAVIEVSNVASPIAAAQLEWIFQPFVQEDSSDSRRADGIGLGLHVVRRLLDAYDGGISVYHREGRVLFIATLPLAARPVPTSPATIDLRLLDGAREHRR
jgi:signal transduction histidine kinase